MGNIIKFGAKGADGTAKAVSCDNNGNLITKRNWDNRVITLYDGMPSGEVVLPIVPLDAAVSSLRIINSTDADIDLGFRMDFPTQELSDYPFAVGTLSLSSSVVTFDNSTVASRKMVSTPDIITLDGNRTLHIDVDEGYTVTLYRFNAEGEYQSSATATHGGTARAMSGGGKYMLKIVKNSGAVEQTGVEEYLSHVRLYDSPSKALYNLIEGTPVSLTVPHSAETRGYIVTPADLPCLNYLSAVNLAISPKGTISEGLFTIYLVKKK